MMEEWGNNKHNNYNENETDSITDTTKKGKLTCSDITYPNMMDKTGNKKPNDNN